VDIPFPPAHRHARPLPALVLLAAAAVAAPATADPLRYEEGLARAPGGGPLLYREQHWLRLREGRPLERLVLYRCPDGIAFARKQVDYRGSAQAPAFALEDARSGYREGLRRTGPVPGPVVFVREGGRVKEAARELPSGPIVADAGFDEFIRAHWDALVAGESLPLQFAVPARLRSLPFSLQRVGGARVGGERAHVFRLRLQGWLGLLAPRIEVSYGERSRRLLRFEGLSNLRDDAGRAQLLARIEFPAAPRGAAEEEWRQAASRPLAACRTGQRADAADTPDSAALAYN
jgi:hypothetical protein